LSDKEKTDAEKKVEKIETSRANTQTALRKDLGTLTATVEALALSIEGGFGEVRKDLSSVKGNLTRVTSRVGTLEKIEPTPAKVAADKFVGEDNSPEMTREELRAAFLEDVAARAAEAFDALDSSSRRGLAGQLEVLYGGLTVQTPQVQNRLATFMPTAAMNQKARFGRTRAILRWLRPGRKA